MSIKILLADDSITIQKVIGIIFGGEDYALTVVDNGKAAIDKARELSPDVLLIDALMPGMSGYEVCEAVRATPALATKPILILTGSFEPFDEAKAKSCGADDFLAKPFESQQIVNKVKELYELGASRAAVQPAPSPPPVAPAFAVPPATPQEPAAIAEQFIAEPAEDIWSAFTITEEPAPGAVPSSNVVEPAFEQDAFAIISEEPEAQITQSPATPASHTGSQWVPVEEHTFEFAEETITEVPLTTVSDQAPPMQEIAFGDISFEQEPAQAAPITYAVEPAPMEAAQAAMFSGTIPTFTETAIPELSETITPAFTEPAAPADVTAAASPPETASATIAQPAEAAIAPSLTEEQLRSAIASVSQEVIQRIVWEVVPDLAETLIKEAIRKIKEGL